MQTRDFCGKKISLLGFGLMRFPGTFENTGEFDYDAAAELVDYAIANGVNYFDTAYTYGRSEAFAGEAFAKHPRESYYLATKCPPWMVKSPDDFERIFSEQLERCRTDYFDFYLAHNFAQEMKRAKGNAEYFKHFENTGMYDMLQRKKAQGKIRHVGFSFHGTPALLEEITAKYKWDFAQIQLNYIDSTATEAIRQYEILEKRGIPVVIMEPLRGGALARLSEDAAAVLKRERPEESVASWGIRYSASFENVITVLSGMNEMFQLKDNLSVMKRFEPVSEREIKLLEEAATLYSSSGAIPCTGCRYCMPCPAGVDIPRVFSIYNHYRIVGYRIPFDNGYSTLTEDERASSCINCGKCVGKCPQHLEIPQFLKEIDEFASSAEHTP